MSNSTEKHIKEIRRRTRKKTCHKKQILLII